MTALQLERRAVCAHLSDVTTAQARGLVLDIGELLVAGAQPLRVGVLETGPGNIGAATLTVQAEESYRPTTIVMVGVAGGIKDVRIGDVVASSKVYWVEGGKEGDELATRPEVANVSPYLVQLARAVAADGAWLPRAAAHGGGDWPDAGRTAQALVAPIVAGEKVVASSRSATANIIRRSYSDAVAVAMEEFGVLRGGTVTERARTLSVRGISDLMDKKSAADEAGSQIFAAANAASFTIELLGRLQRTTPGALDFARLAEIGASLYPTGPRENALWERAGGDPSRLSHAGPGFALWFEATRLLAQGGGGATAETLIRVMRQDFPNNVALQELG